MKNFLKLWLPSAIFLLALAIVGTNLDKPFWGTHDWNGARYGNIAKNYLRYGLIETKFGQVENGGLTKPSDFIYYTHYQPLVPLLISVSYKVLGVSEFATRVVPLLITAGFAVILYFIGLELVSWQTGLFAALLALFSPMLRYYGKNPVHEPIALFFASVAFLGALSFQKGRKWGWTVLIVGFVLTALTNWSFVFLLPALTVFLFEKKNLKKIYILWLMAFILAILHFLHARILTGSFFGGGLGEAFLERTSIDNVAVPFSITEYILRIRLWSSTLLTNTLLVSSLLGLFLILKSKLGETKKYILSIFIYCIYPIFFANASFIHSYFIYYLIFPLSLLGGYFCFRIFNYKKILIVFVLVILTGIWFERLGYLMALDASNGDKLAVEMATKIKNQTEFMDTVLVEPYEYAYSRLPILSFYSDRNIVLEGNATWDAKLDGNSYTLIKQ